MNPDAGALVFLLCLGTAACSAAATAYQKEFRAAERAYAAGRYPEAGDAWNRAAGAAQTARERDEARYRRAASLVRAGRSDEAAGALSELVAESPSGGRAARAAYDLVTLDCARSPADCRQRLDSFIRRYPRSGLARPALARLVGGYPVGEQGLLRDHLAELSSALSPTETAEHISHALAHSFRTEGRLKEAREIFEATARRHPYPTGALWDDALWYAADLDLALGQPRQAISRLEQLLARREPALWNGSYERPRYAAARFRIAEIFRDVLGMTTHALENFDLLFREHETSLLRDDALFAAALLARESGDGAGACRRMQTLRSVHPGSRYARCGQLVCDRLPDAEGSPCSGYVGRTPPRLGLPAGALPGKGMGAGADEE